MLRNKGILILGASSMIIAMGTASFGQELSTHAAFLSESSRVDVEVIAKNFEKQAEYIDSIKYGTDTSVSSALNALPMAPTGQAALLSQIWEAETEQKENLQQDVGVTSTDLEFDSYQIKTSNSDLIKADLKYYATRTIDGGVYSSPWKEEVVYGIEIDPKNGQITNVINKDIDWIHENIPDDEIVEDDGLTSGEEGISTDEMREIDQQSALQSHANVLQASDSYVPLNMDYWNRQKVKRYARDWWNKRNPAYPRYRNDCTNFASQALHYGGWEMVQGPKRVNSNWWATKSDSSWAWSGAENFYKFAIHKSKRSELHYQQETKYLREGDIVQYKDPGKKKMTHTMVVTGIDQRGVLVSYHTNDNLDRPIRDFFKPGRIWYPHKLKS